MANDIYGTSGHGYKVYVEDDPVGNPDHYELVGGLTSEVVHEWTREYTKTTPHDAGVGGGVISNVLERTSHTFENNYKPGNVIYDNIIREHFRNNREFKVKMVGPGGSAGNDEIIETGGIIKLGYKAPNEAGQRVMTWEFMGVGAYQVDGVTYE